MVSLVLDQSDDLAHVVESTAHEVLLDVVARAGSSDVVVHEGTTGGVGLLDNEAHEDDPGMMDMSGNLDMMGTMDKKGSSGKMDTLGNQESGS